MPKGTLPRFGECGEPVGAGMGNVELLIDISAGSYHCEGCGWRGQGVCWLFRKELEETAESSWNRLPECHAAEERAIDARYDRAPGSV